jgi:hypothetical protein
LVCLVFAPHAEPAEAGAAQLAQHAQRAPAGGQEELWRDPLVRWCAAALLQRYCCSSDEDPAAARGITPEAPPAAQPGGPAAGPVPAAEKQPPCSLAGQGAGAWQLLEAKALAEHFAAVSFGDALFGVAVALLLRRAVPLDIQVGLVVFPKARQGP